MGSVFDIFAKSSRRHVSDDQVLALMDGELSMRETRRVQKHLERCWNCRTRQDKLQGVIHGFVDYSNDVVAPFLPPPPGGRDRFLAALDVELIAHSRSWSFHPIGILRKLHERAMNPVFLTAVVLVVAGIALTMVWTKLSTRQLAPEQLLAQAVQAEQAVQPQAGVVYQRVEIRSGHHTAERLIYRDLAHKRVPREQKLGVAESAMKSRLEAADVNWQNPLSVTDFRTWHDRMRNVRDQVSQTSPGELTLTTETDDSTVQEASLTVRDSDFHPIARRVIYRDDKTIEIAELNYDVLPWSVVNASLFEPLRNETLSGGAVPRAALHVALPTPDQLMGAQLEAQLALLKLNANAGEDIRVEPGQAVVHVRGFVDTDDRKREMDAALGRIALVKPELQSYEQIERMRRASQGGGTLQVASIDLQASPLDQLVSQQGMSKDDAIALSRTLTQASIVIARESHVLQDLDAHYGNVHVMDEKNLARLDTLKQGHLAVLRQALASEEAALVPYAHASSFRDGSPAEPLPALASTNQQLCTDLIAGAGDNPQPAGMILNNLVRVSAQIRTAVSSLQPSPRP